MKKIKNIILICCGAVAIVSSYFLWNYHEDRREEADILKDIKFIAFSTEFDIK